MGKNELQKMKKKLIAQIDILDVGLQDIIDFPWFHFLQFLFMSIRLNLIALICRLKMNKKTIKILFIFGFFLY